MILQKSVNAHRHKKIINKKKEKVKNPKIDNGNYAPYRIINLPSFTSQD